MLLHRLFVRASSAGRFAQQAAPALVVAQQSTDQSQISKVACLALLVVAGGGVAHAEATTPPDQQKGWHLLSLDQRRRLFFKYERRVRDMSPQEKVFDYFASRRDVGGASFMLAGDMLRAVVPVYPPEGCSFVRSGSLAGEPSPKVPEEESVFFKNFDLDGDGRISFEEYMLFVTLLSIPPEDIEVAFKILDVDNSGKIDAGEFSRLLGALQGQAGAQKATTRHLDHTQSGERAGLLRKFFGNDGQKQLTLDAFEAFMDALREELVRLEYQYYDCQSKGYMTGRDFAHSIVGSASARFLDEYLNKVQAMPAELADAHITLQELGAFREVLRQLRALLVALEFIQNSSRTVTEADLHWVAEHILHTKLTKAQVDIVFYLFGSKEHGLNPRYMHKVLSRHPATGLRIVYEYQAGQADSGKKSLLDCIRECHSSL